MLLYGKITGSTIVRELRVVTKVIDGDTIVVNGGRSVRLLDMDTAETGEDCYSEAKQRLEELILNQEVYLEAGRENSDRYGRLLRYVFLDEQNVNLVLVEEGLAIAMIYDQGRYSQDIIEAEANAMDDEIGCQWED